MPLSTPSPPLQRWGAERLSTRCREDNTVVLRRFHRGVASASPWCRQDSTTAKSDHQHPARADTPQPGRKCKEVLKRWVKVGEGDGVFQTIPQCIFICILLPIGNICKKRAVCISIDQNKCDGNAKWKKVAQLTTFTHLFREKNRLI